MSKHVSDLDIYFKFKYAKLNKFIDGGVAQKFIFKNNDGEIHYQFIKRVIPVRVGNEDFYDIITPYGYGGPIIITCKDNVKNRLIEEFSREFNSYCEKNKIVSEFIRFHPIVRNYLDFKTLYDTVFLRNTVGIDLNNEDILMNEFSRTCRNRVRKGIKLGLHIKFDFKCETIDDFYKIYMQTMKKNHASDYYYFPDSYFKQIPTLLGNHAFIVNVLLDEKIIATTLFFQSDYIIHSHLVATLPEYYHYCAHNLLYFEVSKWGKNNGKRLIHLGGGITNDTEDRLFKFKKNFTKNTIFNFYIGKKIINKKIYKQLSCENIQKKKFGKEFFPLYRA